MPTWTDTLENIRFLFINEFQRHGELADSGKCSPSEKEYYRKVRHRKGHGGRADERAFDALADAGYSSRNRADHHH
jgi:hypothetical protein